MNTESAQVAILFIALYALGFGVYWAKVFSSRHREDFKADTGHDWDAQISFFAFLVCVFWPVMFIFTILSAFLPARGSK